MLWRLPRPAALADEDDVATGVVDAASANELEAEQLLSGARIAGWISAANDQR